MDDWLVDPLKVLLAVAVGVLALMGVVNFLVPDTLMTVSLGYSMCGYHSPYVDFLSLQRTTCSIEPGDAMFIAHVRPDVNDVVCVDTRVGMICHRAYKVTNDGVCIVGDAAKWRACYSWDAYVGKVVGKLPRAVSMPGTLVWAVLHQRWDALQVINNGRYDLASS